MLVWLAVLAGCAVWLAVLTVLVGWWEGGRILEMSQFYDTVTVRGYGEPFNHRLSNSQLRDYKLRTTKLKDCRSTWVSLRSILGSTLGQRSRP